MRKVHPGLIVGLFAAIGLWAFSRTARGGEIVDDVFDYGGDVLTRGWNVLSRMLQDAPAHITGTFDELRSGVRHGAVDFNYVGGQQGINLIHPEVRAPIDGVVTFAGGQYGTVKIEDREGYSHELLHHQDLLAHVGQIVSAGDVIGTMGGRGPLGPAQFAQHVHYQLRSPDGIFVDPVAWWNDRGVTFA